MKKGAWKKKKGAPPPDDDEREERKPGELYGWPLILRALASFAIRFPERPGALRVLCVVSDYVNQDGECRVSQATIADRLGLTRNAVNQHLKFLDKTETLIAGAPYGDGKLKTYIFDCDHVRDERQGQDAVERGRAERRAARREREAGGRVTPKAPWQPKQDKPKERPISVGDCCRDGEYIGIVTEITDRWAWIKISGDAKLQSDVSQLKRLLPGDPGYFEPQPEPPEQAAPEAASPEEPTKFWAGFRIGDLARHGRFGIGRVDAIDGNKVTVLFKSGERRVVVASYLEPVLESDLAAERERPSPNRHSSPGVDAERDKEQPIAVGDRVRHIQFRGVGTVKEITEEDGHRCAVVLSDKTKNRNRVNVAELERILPGDPALEPPAPLQCRPGDFVWHYEHGYGRVEDVGADTVRVFFGSGEEHEVNPAFLIEGTPATV